MCTDVKLTPGKRKQLFSQPSSHETGKSQSLDVSVDVPTVLHRRFGNPHAQHKCPEEGEMSG